MQVQAYQDPVSKRLFATEAELMAFIALQSLAEASDQQIQALNKHFIEKLSTPAQLEALVRDVFNKYFELKQINSTTRETKIISLHCEDIEILYSRNAPPRISFHLKYEINKLVYLKEETNFTKEPLEVLEPFKQLSSCTINTLVNGNLVVSYFLIANIAYFPLLNCNLALYQDLINEQKLHEAAIDTCVEATESADTELILAITNEEIAAAEYSIVRARHRNATLALEEATIRIRRSVRESMPFEKLETLEEAEELIGKYLESNTF
jgi:hypothetical protein